MNRFDVLPTPLPGVRVVQRRPIDDDRGFFCRLFCVKEFNDGGILFEVAQINHTLTRHVGTVRGLHFQMPPYAEMKLVTCLKGQIYDVAVDVRKDSSTFLRWHGEVLSEANRKSLLIPDGFAHGFQTLTSNCELLYFHTAAYAPNREDALNAMDPTVGVDWPLEVTEMSERDRGHRFVNEEFTGVKL